jgi:hypothetical protein
MKYAPIAIFAFNRPHHFDILFQSLIRNPEAKESSVTVFLDHPRGRFRTPENIAVEEVAKRYANHFTEFTIILRPYNFGLAHNMLNGVSEILRTHERIIVLEDDLELSPDFLRYMNEALEKYATYTEVASIHAYVYPGFDGG